MQSFSIFIRLPILPAVSFLSSAFGSSTVDYFDELGKSTINPARSSLVLFSVSALQFPYCHFLEHQQKHSAFAIHQSCQWPRRQKH
jgi:hypothetical protein